MAIYHFHAEKGKRWGSAAAKHAYISRAGKYEKCGDEVLHQAHGRMPAWGAADPAIFWAAADARERSNGRLYREYEFALPRELSQAQQEALAEDYAEHITGEYSLPWSLAIHAGGGTNPHCHLIVNERMNDGLPRSAETWFSRWKSADPGAGGAKKTDALEKPKKFQWIREQWEVVCNLALAAAGSDARIDHRTLKAQGIDREPTRHVGPAVMAMEKRGIRPERGVDPTVAVGEPEDVRGLLKSEDEENDDERNRARDRAIERGAGAADALARGSKRRAGEVAALDQESKRRARRNKRRADSVRVARKRRAEEERARLVVVRGGAAADPGGGGESDENAVDQSESGAVRDVPARALDADREREGGTAGGGGAGAGGQGSARRGAGRGQRADSDMPGDTPRVEAESGVVRESRRTDGRRELTEAARRANWLKVGGSGMLEPAVLVAVVWGPGYVVPGYTVDRRGCAAVAGTADLAQRDGGAGARAEPGVGERWLDRAVRCA